jgi:hypothetical protein
MGSARRVFSATAERFAGIGWASSSSSRAFWFAGVLPGGSVFEVAVQRVPDAVDAVLGLRGPE